METRKSAGVFLGISIAIGLALLGFQLANAAISVKQFERSVTVKGLSEREVMADIVLWPIQFSAASNDLSALYDTIEKNTSDIQSFLVENGIDPDDISASAPAITDKSAQQWGGNDSAKYRYTATQTITVYSENIDTARAIMPQLSELGKQGIVFTSGSYDTRTEYIYTRLNDIKPSMVEEATQEARAVAQKFASDSDSQLGKIKRASQGQFSITERDKNNPHIKKVRVVSTIEYYLSD
ncbi:hypothetical protein CWE15_09055 [Aliidiomarina taiwanensis]|uniref:SIMPL domain-containing protein n=1 Tax=Aliidiomarina taiwanensis TaxID=946228 RepID=A0A432X152_9GAMM|nr:SIMPL domain-containing protein [Aliidiomarina taiwanensis]RUO39889.1 hypothetical protein CWE15_09055 [Aliidiomarina taiwanensis]